MTLNLSSEKMMELAKIVYQGEHDKVIVIDGQVCYANPWTTAGHPVTFAPSLTGEDWQKAQALDVIVAAWRMASRCQYVLYKDLMVRGFEFKRDEDGDILTASVMALLADRGKG